MAENPNLAAVQRACLALARSFEGRGRQGIPEETALLEFGRIASRMRYGYEPAATEELLRGVGKPVLENLARLKLLGERARWNRRHFHVTADGLRLLTGGALAT